MNSDGLRLAKRVRDGASVRQREYSFHRATHRFEARTGEGLLQAGNSGGDNAERVNSKRDQRQSHIGTHGDLAAYAHGLSGYPRRGSHPRDHAQNRRVVRIAQLGHARVFPVDDQDESAADPSDPVDEHNLAKHTRKALAMLTPREEHVLRKRFEIGEESDHTLEEIGQEFRVTRERIRQIQVKALSKLVNPKRSGRLQPFQDR
jgi:RNA polymerase sigma factor (sigma-70 family)